MVNGHGTFCGRTKPIFIPKVVSILKIAEYGQEIIHSKCNHASSFSKGRCVVRVYGKRRRIYIPYFIVDSNRHTYFTRHVISQDSSLCLPEQILKANLKGVAIISAAPWLGLPQSIPPVTEG
ncbi:hypothetical protein AVEN_102854-1 [Araneus ventricosus]|uniref:Uncharacterized protein n=1 Tax=Araneus ventricosus TaxID=182803 RepID=A0A4Y2LCM0_ARAVE|nr:hypothetical protein AVEN_102854-1 [Araneus ventricosus]